MYYMYSQYWKRLNIIFYGAIFLSLSITAAPNNGNPDLGEYLGESIEHVIHSLQDRSIQINWASSVDHLQVLSYRTHLIIAEDTFHNINIKCFFKKKICIGKAITIPGEADTTDFGTLFETDEHLSGNTYDVELEISEGKSTIYMYRRNKGTQIKKLNNAPMTVETVDQVIRKSNIINRYFWGSCQVGFPYYSSILNNAGVSASYSSDKTHFLYTLQYKKTSYENASIIYDINEISYLSAYLLSEGKLRMTFCAGLSYLFWDETFIDNSSNESTSHNNGLGIPIEAQYYLRINRNFGVGVSLRANINGSKTFYQFGSHMLFGKIR